jgi:carbon storage regulator
MLVLTRKVGEVVVIGDGVTVTVLRAEGQRVRLGIGAPECVSIRREELTSESVDETGDINEGKQRHHGRSVPSARKSR